LENLIGRLFDEWYKADKSSSRCIENASNTLFDSIFLQFNDENLHIIEEEIQKSSLEKVLNQKNMFFASDYK